MGQRLHRVEAIRCEPGALGCGRSHIKALELAWLHSEWTWVMMLEDDFTFCSGSQAAALALRRLMTHDESMDVAVLAFNPLCAELIPTGNGNFHRVVRSQTTSGYVIRHGYIPTLLNNFREAMDRMERAGRSTESDCSIWPDCCLPCTNENNILGTQIGARYRNATQRPLDEQRCSGSTCGTPSFRPSGCSLPITQTSNIAR